MSDKFIPPDPSSLNREDLVQTGASPPRASDEKSAERSSVLAREARVLANVATNLWKARLKMQDAAGEVREEMKRVYRHIDSALESLHDLGIQVKDHTGDAFDYGLPLKVVSTQPTAGISREKVVECIKPTVYWHQHMIQMGEVIIATPT